MFTVESLLEMKKAFDDKDPWLKNGIKRSFVCVVHPSMISHLRLLNERFKILYPEMYKNIALDWLSGLMKRDTYIIEEALPDLIEYLSPEDAKEKYPRFFREKSRLDAEEILKITGDDIIYRTHLGYRNFNMDGTITYPVIS